MFYAAWKCVLSAADCVYRLYLHWLLGPIPGICPYTPLGNEISLTLYAHFTSKPHICYALAMGQITILTVRRTASLVVTKALIQRQFFDNKSCVNTYPTSFAVTDPDSRTTARRPSSIFDDIVDHVVHNERELYTVTNHVRQH